MVKIIKLDGFKYFPDRNEPTISWKCPKTGKFLDYLISRLPTKNQRITLTYGACHYDNFVEGCPIGKKRHGNTWKEGFVMIFLIRDLGFEGEIREFVVCSKDIDHSPLYKTQGVVLRGK